MRMLLFLLILFSPLLLRSVKADGGNSSSKDAIVSALQTANLTTLANLGKDIIDGLVNSNQSSNLNYTLLAPNNAAFENQPEDLSSKLPVILRYHTLPGNFLNASSSSQPNIDAASMPLVTVARTLLTDGNYVHLEGGKAQVVVWTKNGTMVQDQPDGTVHVLNQSPEIFILNTTTVVLPSNTSAGGGNQRTLLIATISGILLPPPSLSQILQFNDNNLTSFSGLLDTVGVADGLNVTDLGGNGGNGGNGSNGSNGANGLDGADGEDGGSNSTHNGLSGASVRQLLESTSRTRGFTLFAPNNDAIKLAGTTTLASLVNNQTGLRALVGNHYINGTSYYSSQLVSSSTSDSTFVSASGQTFTFSTNATGAYVTCGTSGNRADGMEAAASNARIVRTDVLASNGVVHVIDRVLVNLDVDERKAADAYQSAVSKAQTESTSTPTGPIEPASTDSSSSSSINGNNQNSAQSVSSSSIFSFSISSLASLFGQWYQWSALRGTWGGELGGMEDKEWKAPGWGFGALVGGILGLGVGVVAL